MELKPRRKEFEFAGKKLFAEAQKQAAKKGLQRHFLQLTYADGWQDPFGRRSKAPY
jgi:hypothetical protein